MAKDADIPNLPIIATDVSAAPGAMNNKERENKTEIEINEEDDESDL